MPPDLATAQPVDEQTLRDVERFLFREAELVDDRNFEPWLDLFADDLDYRGPIRVWRGDSGHQIDPVACYFSDTKQTLQIRVQRIEKGLAWAESPPSVARHFVNNLRVIEGPEADQLTARANVLITRSRGPSQLQETFALDRIDTLRRAGDSFQIVRRLAILDSSMPSAQNLAIFF